MRPGARVLGQAAYSSWTRRFRWLALATSSTGTAQRQTCSPSHLACCGISDGPPHHHPQDAPQGETDPRPHAVRPPPLSSPLLLTPVPNSGLDNAGKTTIVKRILGEDVNEVSPTLGFNIRTIIHQGYSLNVCAHLSRSSRRSQLTLGVGDIGGQTSLRPYWRNYFETTDAVIWVVDSSDRARMEDCRRELHGLLQEEVRILPIARAKWELTTA